MAEDTEGGGVVPGVFGGNHNIEHLIKHLRDDAKPEVPALVMFENKDGEFVPIVLNLTTEELCLFKEMLGGIIRSMMNGSEWEE